MSSAHGVAFVKKAGARHSSPPLFDINEEQQKKAIRTKVMMGDLFNLKDNFIKGSKVIFPQ